MMARISNHAGVLAWNCICALSYHPEKTKASMAELIKKPTLIPGNICVYKRAFFCRFSYQYFINNSSSLVNMLQK